MKLNKKLIAGFGGCVLAVVVIVLISGSGAKKREAAKRESETKMAFQSAPRPVRFERVKAVEDVEPRSYPGIVKASEETALSFRVGGPLTEVNVILGEPVRKGDLLMQIDPRDFEDRIQSLEAQLSGAKAMQQNAQQDYRRIVGLFEEKVVPQSDYDHAKSALDSADASVKNLEVQLQIARHALADTSLVAPYDGTVSKQMAENHEMIDPGRVVLQFHDIQLLEVTVNVPENEIITRPTKENTDVVVTFPAVPGRSFNARLKEWSTVADQMTRTYAVTFEFAAPQDLKVLPGMSASIVLDKGISHDQVLTVPVSALSPGSDGGSILWIYEEAGGNACQRNVLAGNLIGASRVIIAEGVSEGELVVVSGSRLIHENLSLKTVSVR